MPINRVHAFTKLLYDRLCTIPVGETVTYSSLSALIGRDVQNDGRHYLTSARRMALHKDRVVFDVTQDVGLVRMDDAGVVQVAEGFVRKVRRSARRGRRVLAVVDTSKLTPDQVAKADATRLQLSLAHLFGGSGFRKRIDNTIKNRGELAAPADVMRQSLKAFAK